jgi:tight adherence protein B
VVLGRLTLIVLVVAGVAAGLHRLRQRARRRAAAVACRARVIEACGVLASDLRAGRVPGDALTSAATICPELGPAAMAARLGDDVPAALDLAAATPGASGLRALGAGWRVAQQSGAALAAVAERIADALRGEEQVRRQVVAGLAGTRATGRLLAGLPVLGLGLGYAVGAHPLDFLTGTLIGWLCLSAGLILAGAGMAWIERLADSREGDLR